MNDLLTHLLKAIKSEAEAIDFYERLLRFSPGTPQQEDIRHVLADERIHLRDFTRLYCSLTGTQPVYTLQKTTFHNLQEGLRIAYRDELEAYEFYRNTYLMTADPTVRDIFFRALTDEIEHAIRLGFLRIQN